MNQQRRIVLAIIVVAIAGFFIFDVQQYLSFYYLQQQHAQLEALVSDRPLFIALVFFIIYVAVTGLSLPGAAIMTLAAGAMFGLLAGTLIVSFASTIGATLAFLVSRFLLQNSVQSRFESAMKTINDGVAREGAFYLFTVRLIPLFPFFVINLVMGLTKIPVRTYYWVSQVGMLPGTLVYVYAGTQLANLTSAEGILSPGLIIAFALLAGFPWLARHLVSVLKARKALAPYPKPDHFDRNLIVIGAGAAGLVASYIAAAVKAKVTLVEKHKMGGDCLNTGCVPSKALIRTAKFLNDAKQAEQLGVAQANTSFDFGAVMDRVQRVIAAVEPHDSVERYTGLGVECLQGTAKVVSPYCVEIDGEPLTARNIVIASGARPFVPPIGGLEQVDYLTSDNLWQLRELPQRLIVLGGGPIGCEMSQAFTRLGSQVTQVEMGDRLLPREDEEVSAYVLERFQCEGVDVRLGHLAQRVEQVDGQATLFCKVANNDVSIPFDKILVAVGRRANTDGLGLEALGIKLRTNGTIETNEYLQTSMPTIFASGDVAGPYQFTHTAAHQSWYAAVNSLFGFIRKFKVDYRVIPWVTFTDPEVARVGINEQEARERQIPYEVTRYGIDDLDRAIADEAAKGFIKVLTVPGKDKILGVTIVGVAAGELLAEYTLAMKYKLGLNKILGTIHSYPTLAESNKYVAGEWKKAHAPAKILAWVEQLHAKRL